MQPEKPHTLIGVDAVEAHYKDYLLWTFAGMHDAPMSGKLLTYVP